MFRMLKLNCLSYKKEQFPAPGSTVISVANQYPNDQFQRKMAVYCIASNLNYFVPRLTSSNALQSTCMLLWTKNKFLFQWFGNLEAIERTFLHNVCSYQYRDSSTNLCQIYKQPSIKDISQDIAIQKHNYIIPFSNKDAQHISIFNVLQLQISNQLQYENTHVF